MRQPPPDPKNNPDNHSAPRQPIRQPNPRRKSLPPPPSFLSPPSFRRRPESRTPAGFPLRIGGGMDSRLSYRHSRPAAAIPAVIPAQAGIQNPGGLSFADRPAYGFPPILSSFPPRRRHSCHPPPSFRRRPESRTPAGFPLRIGEGMDSRFRGNDGGRASANYPDNSRRRHSCRLPPSFRRRPESRTPAGFPLRIGRRMGSHPSYRHSRESGNPHPAMQIFRPNQYQKGTDAPDKTYYPENPANSDADKSRHISMPGSRWRRVDSRFRGNDGGWAGMTNRERQ